MVNNMQAKACDGDPISAKVFKEISPLINNRTNSQHN